MSRIFTRRSLAGSGAILGLIRGALTFAPKAFLESERGFHFGEHVSESERSADECKIRRRT